MTEKDSMIINVVENIMVKNIKANFYKEREKCKEEE
jgi:hypothetical protein